MRKSVSFIVLLKNLSTGILASVLSLAMLQHGASIQTISLLLGLYSFTVILAEFPSGVFADLYGRKTSFLLSAALFFASYCLFFVSETNGILCAAIVLNGLGRAFSSGSIDALAIDQANEHGKSLESVTSRLAILESVGLAAGALLGGFLSGLGSRYLGNIGVNAAIQVLLFLITAVFVQESLREKPKAVMASSLSAFGAQAASSLAFLKQRGTVRILAAFALFTGFALSAVETYWQPALLSMQPVYWIFGAVSFAGFAFVILGSWLAERLLRRFAAKGVALLLALKALLGICLLLLVVPKGQGSFIVVYLAIYGFIGSSSVTESTLLNRLVPSSDRAGVLSLASLILQLGGLLAAFCGYFVSSYGRYQNIWLLAGAILIIGAIVFTLFSKKTKQQADHEESCPG